MSSLWELMKLHSIKVSNSVSIDYTITIPEDREVGVIVRIVELTDVFSVGTYEITLYKG